MKQRIGQLRGKQIVVTNYPDEVAYNEILAIESPEGIELKDRDTNGELKDITKSKAKEVKTNDVEYKDVLIQYNTSISGCNKWLKGSDYIFYSNKLDKVQVSSDGKDITDALNIVATGKVNKVYQIPAKYYGKVTINDH